MAKDPAFLFYSADAAEDTQHLDRLERGAYFDILKAQKRFGKFTLEQLHKVLGNDFEKVWPALKMCLTHEQDMYFIAWVDESIEKRKEYSESRRSNRNSKKNGPPGDTSSSNVGGIFRYEQDKKNTSSSYVEHMGNVIGNVNEDVNEDVNREGKEGMGEKETKDEAAIVPRMLTVWKAAKPKYIFRGESDLPALRMILRIILKEEKISLWEPDAIERVLATWETLVAFVCSDVHFSGYQLSQVEKYFSAIASKLVVSNTRPNSNGKSILETNMEAANGALRIIMQKYGKGQAAN
jgi:hypothetical protein